MRILQSDNPRPLNLLAVGAAGRVAAASDALDATDGIDVWDATTGAQEPAPRTRQQGLAGLAFASKGQFVFSEYPRGITFGHSYLRYHLSVATFDLYPDGERLLFTATDTRGRIECWHFRSAGTFGQTWAERLGEFHRCGAPATDPTGARVAAIERYDGRDGRPCQDAVLRDAETGKPSVRIGLDPVDPVRQLAFTADGSKLLARTDSRTVHLFDASTGKPAAGLVHRGRPFVTAIAVHPRGPVACARTDGTVTFWDADKLTQLRTLDWKVGKLVSLAFSPDGALGAAGTEDGKVVVWDVDV